MKQVSQLILRNEALIGAGPLLLVNPPRDTLHRQLVSPGRSIIRISTQDYGDFRWLEESGADAACEVLPAAKAEARAVILRQPREKERLAVMLHAISSWISEEARLWLVGENRAGIKSSSRLLGNYFLRAAKLDAARHCGLYEASNPKREVPFNLDSYQESWRVEFAGHDISIASLPGVFAHGRLDRGSQLLLEVLERLHPAGKVLDFACGSGVIGLSLLSRDRNLDLTMLDVSTLAIESSRRSLEANGSRATLLHSDGLSNVNERYDWIISNPPFHRGIENDLDVAARFFSDAGTFLVEKGKILIVCNRHLPYAAWLKRYFEQVECLAADSGYSVIMATRPRRLDSH